MLSLSLNRALFRHANYLHVGKKKKEKEKEKPRVGT